MPESSLGRAFQVADLGREVRLEVRGIRLVEPLPEWRCSTDQWTEPLVQRGHHVLGDTELDAAPVAKYTPLVELTN